MAAATACLMTACVSDDTDFSGIIDGDNGGGDTYVPKKIAFDTTPLQEAPEEIPSDDNDYVENSPARYTVKILYSDNAPARVEGDVARVNVTVDGGHVTVRSTSSRMEYVLSGTCKDGSFKIYSENKFKLTMANLGLVNPRGAAINNQCGKSMYVELVEGFPCTLRDGETYDMVEGEDQKAAFFSEGQVIFSGAGKLTVCAYGRNAIASDDYIVFRPGNVINVQSFNGNGIKANDGIFIRGGVLNVEVQGNAGKGLNSELDMEITGGRTTVITSGHATGQEDDASSAAAIKCDSLFTVSAGILNLQSTGEGGKGINCDKNILVSGGEVNVVTTGKKTIASPKGIKADGDITFNGGAVYSYSRHSDAIDAALNFSYAEGWTVLEQNDHLFELTY